MKYVLPIIAAIIAGFVGWIIGRAFGQWMYEIYKGTGDMVTASDSIGLKYVTPVSFAIIFAYVAYYLTKGNE